MLSIQSIGLMAGTKTLLENASLTIHPRQKIGLIGQNGAGKSTLLKAILGEVSLEAGSIVYPDVWKIGYVQQELKSTESQALTYVIDGDSLYSEIMVKINQAEQAEDHEAMVRGYDELDRISGYQVPQKAKQLLYGLGFESADFTKQLSQFSGGWQVRLKLARALMQRSDLLLLDEPTNHLDIEAVTWLVQWLKSYEGAVIVISHDRFFLDEVVDGIAQMEHHKLYFYSGNFEAFERQKNEQLMQQQALHDAQKQQMQQLKTFIERFKAKASKAKQAQSRVKALQRIEEVAAVQAANPFHFEFIPPETVPDPMMQIESLSFGYDGHPVIENTDLVLRAGDRIGLVGINGSGKSTLLKLLVGDLKPKSGKILPAKGLKVGYFAQHQLEALHLDQSPVQHLQGLKTQENDMHHVSDQEARDFLGRFGFTHDKSLSEVGRFSGGEKARLSLALMVYQQPNLIILDEPTNHLDMETRDALDMALQAFEGALILVTHDRHLLSSIVDQYWWVHGGRVESDFGTLEDYLNQRLQLLKDKQTTGESEPSGVEVTAPSKKVQRQANAQVRKQIKEATRQQSAELKQVEREMDGLQTKIEALHATMEDESLYQADRNEELTELLKDEATAKKRMEALEERWLLLEEEISEITARYE